MAEVMTDIVVIAEVRTRRAGRGGKGEAKTYTPLCIVPGSVAKETVQKMNESNVNPNFSYSRMPNIPYVEDITELVKVRQAQKTEDARAAALKRLKPDELRALGLVKEAEEKEKAIKEKEENKEKPEETSTPEVSSETQEASVEDADGDDDIPDLDTEDDDDDVFDPDAEDDPFA